MVKRHSYADDVTQWLAHIASQRETNDVQLLNNTIQLCETVPPDLLVRGLHIADILFELGLDSETLATAILYTAVQNKYLHIDTVIDTLGENSGIMLNDVLQMQMLGKLQQLKQRSHTQIENLRKMLLAMVTDVRAVLIVLAERLWQLHEIKGADEKEQRQLAQETLDVFAPLANRLGIWQLKWEIEDMCFRYLHPQEYSKVAKWLASRRQEREQYLERVTKIVTEMLNKAHVKNFQMSGRVKHIYSIYNKMQRKGSSFDEIYDISALRVLVPSVDDCYTVLSILQDAWPHVPKEFDDYISQPKANGYRSIHTVVQGPDNHFIEIQIRTYQMHQESELGMAAHWQYKEGVLQTSNYEAKIALLRQIMAWQKEITSTEEKKEQAVQDLFADRVYVFTPTGDIIDLPQGSTPLDFAYHIHSEVGHRCRGAKIDGKLVPLTYQLQTGERVEILTAKQANPSRDWLNPHLGYLKTPRARSRAQHWFRMRDIEQNILLGREMLDKELKKIGMNEKPDLKIIAEKFHYKTDFDLLAALALGDVKLTQVINQIRPSVVTTHAATAVKPIEQDAASDIQILGINNLLTQIARCCKPLPGDPVVGYVTRNRGVSIHRQSCKNISQLKENEKRLIEVNWGEKTKTPSGNYPVDLQLFVHDRAGVLRDITSCLAGEKINVVRLQTQKTSHPFEAFIYLTIEISNRDELQKAIGLLQQVPNVLEARRR